MAGFIHLRICTIWSSTVTQSFKPTASVKSPLRGCRRPLRKPQLHTGKFIAGLGIPTVGRHAGRELERCFAGSWEAFEAAIQKGFDFTQLPDFGAVMQENLYTWYADAEEAKLWRPLLEKIHFIKETTPMSITKESPLYGKIVVATGKLEHYTRDGIQNKLLQIGAIPASSVTKKTNYLIVGEKAGSKLTKAQQLGVPTLTEEEFEALLAG